MSMLFGKVCQNGYVVRDIEKAMNFWTEVQRVGRSFMSRRSRPTGFAIAGPIQRSR